MYDFVHIVEHSSFSNLAIYSVGQAGFIIKSKSGKLIGIDLYLSDCVRAVEGHDGFDRLLPKILRPSDLRFDVIIATHFHRDHFDVDSMAELMSTGSPELFCAYDCENDVDALGIDRNRVHFVKPLDIYDFKGITLEFVECDHGDGAPLAVGVIITVDGKRIYETGDTCLRLDRVPQCLKNGAIDILIAPINGAYGNMDEYECAQFAKAVNPKVTIPCHYGMFASHFGQPGLFIEEMRHLGIKYKLLGFGEGFEIN